MADTLTPLPNPGDPDYPNNDPNLAAAIEQERIRRKKTADAKAKAQKAWQRPVAAKITPASKSETKPKSQAFDAQSKARSVDILKSSTQKALDTFGKSPTIQNKVAYQKLAAKYKDKTGKDFSVVSPNAPAVPVKETPSSKGNLVTGAAKTNAGPGFSQQDVEHGLNVVWGGATPNSLGAQPATDASSSNPATSGSNYNGFTSPNATSSGGTASPFVTVPVATTVTKGYSTSTYKIPTIGMAHMSVDSATARFINSLTSGTSEAQSIVNSMIKAGIATKKTSQPELVKLYSTALDWTAQTVNSGNKNYTVNDAIKAIAGANGAGGSGSSAPRDTTQTSYSKKVYTEDEFRTVGNAVAQNLLGRMLSDEEIKKALAAANAESAKSPGKTVTKTHYNAGGTASVSQSTDSGGFNLQGSVQQQLGQTAESQAYTTNNVFNDAMKILASRIG